MRYFEYSILFKSGFDLSNFMFGYDVCKNNIVFRLCTVWSSLTLYIYLFIYSQMQMCYFEYYHVLFSVRNVLYKIYVIICRLLVDGYCRFLFDWSQYNTIPRLTHCAGLVNSLIIKNNFFSFHNIKLNQSIKVFFFGWFFFVVFFII